MVFLTFFKLYEWCQIVQRITINESYKSSETKFIIAIRENPKPPSKMDGSVLEKKSSIKMLGLSFSSTFDWRLLDYLYS